MHPDCQGCWCDLACWLFSERTIIHSGRARPERPRRFWVTRYPAGVNEETLSDTRLRQALKAARQGAWEFDLLTGGGYRSPELQALLGVSKQTPGLADYLASVHEDDRPLILQAFGKLRSGELDESVLRYRFFRDDQRMLWVEQHTFVERDERGAARRLYGLSRDITATKEAEQALQRLNATLEARVAERTAELDARTRALESFVELARDLSLELDPLQLVGRAQEIVLGMLPSGVSTYYELQDGVWQLRSHRGPFHNPALLATLQRGVPRSGIENIDRPYDTRAPHYQDQFNRQTAVTARESFGEIRATAAFPVFVGLKVRGVLVFGIHQEQRWAAVERAVMETSVRSLGLALERAESVAQLAARTSALAAANEELEAFAYSVSHDLRTPVRHIASFNDLLRTALKGRIDDKEARYLSIIAQAGARMNTLIDAMLDLSRTARLPLRLAPVDLGALVAAVRAELEPDVAQRQVRWELAPLPLVAGDHDTLRQVLVNLLSNALKYTRTRDEAVIRVWAEERPQEWAVFVQDNGVGFDERYRERLFRVFQRLHRAEEFEGTGVGLANVRRIVQRHGGQVQAQSAPGEGATFSFSLPK